MAEHIIFPQRLKELRKSRGLNQSDLGKTLDVGKTTISNYETGYSAPDQENLCKIASFFNVTVDYLLGRSVVVSERFSDNRIPILNYIQSLETLFAEHNIIDYINLPKNILPNGEYFGMLVRDNSIDKYGIRQGDIAIIRRQQTLEPGDLALVSLDEQEAMLRTFYQSGKIVSLYPNSSNAAFIPTLIDITKQNYNIFGKVYKAFINF